MLRKTLVMLALGLVTMASNSAYAVNSAGLGSFTVTGAGTSTVQQNLGFQFTVNSTQVVSQLGVFQGSDTVSTAGDTIYLANATTGVILASIVSGSPVSSGAFQYNQLATGVTLNTGVTYAIYATFAVPAANQMQYDTGPSAPSSDVNIVTVSFSNTQYGPAGPAVPTRGFSNILATNFLYAAPSSVPEPASLAMLGLGLVGVAAARRKMARNSA